MSTMPPDVIIPTEGTDSFTAFPIGIERYHRMIELGLFDTSDRVELINGYLVNKMPQGIKHRISIEKLNRLLLTRLPESMSVCIQLPVRFGESEPEPDIAITKPLEARGDRHPEPDDIYLVIEVSESSLQRDRSRKLPTYAEAGLKECWIVNLVDQQVEVYTDPIGSLYRTTTIYTLADSVPLVVAGQTYPALPVKGMI